MYLKDLRKLPHYDIVIDAQIDILNVLSMLFVNSKERIAIPVTGGKAFLTSFYIPEDQKTHNMLTMRNEIMHIFSKRSENTSDVFLYPDADDKKVIDDFLAAKEIENFIVIHPGASLAIKRWPAKYIVNLVDKLHQKGHKIVLTGGPNDKDLIDEIQGLSEVSPSIFLGSLLQATQLISKAKFLVCMDSAASHLANAVKTKAFILYNSYNDPEVIKPPATFLHAITAKTGKEINSITPEEVLAYIERSSS